MGSPETRGQFAGIMNRQIYHKWFTVAQNISSKHFYTCFFIPPPATIMLSRIWNFYYY